jgi:hypothetical protein
MQAERLGDEAFSRFAVSRGAAERLQEWAEFLDGRESAVTVDTRLPIADQLSVDLWLGEVSTKSITKFHRCPAIRDVAISPDGKFAAIVSMAEWSTVEDGAHQDSRFRMHAADFFSLDGTPKLVFHGPTVQYATFQTSGPVWRSRSEVWLPVRSSKRAVWLQVQLGAIPVAKEVAIPEAVGEVRSGFFVNDWMFLYGVAGDKGRWWISRPEGTIPFSELVSGMREDVVDVVPVWRIRDPALDRASCAGPFEYAQLYATLRFMENQQLQWKQYFSVGKRKRDAGSGRKRGQGSANRKVWQRRRILGVQPHRRDARVSAARWV